MIKRKLNKNLRSYLLKVTNEINLNELNQKNYYCLQDELDQYLFQQEV